MKAAGMFISTLLIVDAFFVSYYLGFHSRSVPVIDQSLPPQAKPAPAPAPAKPTGKPGTDKAAQDKAAKNHGAKTKAANDSSGQKTTTKTKKPVSPNRSKKSAPTTKKSNAN